MIIIPTGTDAPIYHWPAATVGLIVFNVLCFVFVPPRIHESYVDEEGVEIVEAPSAFERYALVLGDGLHPVQWVTHNFLHVGFGHLLGNMIFLWAFGMVVEGKLGLIRYLLVYLAIGTLHGAFMQTAFLWSSLGGLPAVGASSIIFGLLAICMIWAPHNEVQLLWIYWFGFYTNAKHFELRYTWVAAIYLAQQVLGVALSGMWGQFAGTELLHLSGALWGTVVGLAMLKLGWVDCEGWDILSVYKKDRKLAKDWKLREARLDRSKKAERAPRRHPDLDPGEDVRSVEDRSVSAVKKVRKLIDMGDFASALSAYDRSARTIPDWPQGSDMLDLIKAMHAQGGEAASLPLMRDYCRKHPGKASKMRLKLGQVLIRDREKPVGALRVLGEIPEGSLSPQLEATRRQLIRQAEGMIEEGVLELEGED